MADELVASGKMVFTKGGITVSMSKTGLEVDVTGTEFIHNIQSIGTSEEALALGDVASPGYFFAINHDATNFVEIRAGSGVADLIKIKPGESCGPVRLASDCTPYAIADTAACRLEYLLIED